jgi:hypothetical protein
MKTTLILVIMGVIVGTAIASYAAPPVSPGVLHDSDQRTMSTVLLACHDTPFTRGVQMPRLSTNWANFARSRRAIQ